RPRAARVPAPRRLPASGARPPGRCRRPRPGCKRRAGSVVSWRGPLRATNGVDESVFVAGATQVARGLYRWSLIATCPAKANKSKDVCDMADANDNGGLSPAVALVHDAAGLRLRRGFGLGDHVLHRGGGDRVV